MFGEKKSAVLPDAGKEALRNQSNWDFIATESYGGESDLSWVNKFPLYTCIKIRITQMTLEVLCVHKEYRPLLSVSSISHFNLMRPCFWIVLVYGSHYEILDLCETAVCTNICHNRHHEQGFHGQPSQKGSEHGHSEQFMQVHAKSTVCWEASWIAQDRWVTER